jgi:hypothetical protein
VSEQYGPLDYAKIKQALVEKLREELTSGDPKTKKLLTDLVLSAILKDSTGAELSSFIKNLDAKLSDFKTALLSAVLKDSAGAELSDYIKNLSRFAPILKGSFFNTPVSANINIFPSNLAPTYSPTTFRIYASFNASGVLTVVRTKDTTTVSEQLNGGNALNANCAYIFDILVESGESINLQYSIAATVLSLKVVEVPGMVS